MFCEFDQPVFWYASMSPYMVVSNPRLAVPEYVPVGRGTPSRVNQM